MANVTFIVIRYSGGEYRAKWGSGTERTLARGFIKSLIVKGMCFSVYWEYDNA